ncbi:LolA family protein [Terracidiphilus sp.]|jgi:outer membrane lipoprotein-sorting protein|uniref:LolA family protein n=1 Tax=Terracidiphilus sp. TaxID=1964191 RepID=UPI003C250FFA
MRARKLLFFLSLAAPFLFVIAAPISAKADDLHSVLDRLNAAAKKFHSVSANLVFDTETQDPIPDSDIQKGIAYYQRDGSNFKMAAHFNDRNGHPVKTAYNISGGAIHFFDGTEVHTVDAAKWQSYLILGFGASGTELADKWDIKYLGSSVLDGVNVAQLELVAKDPQVRKNIAKVIIWIDPDRGVSLKQRFDESASAYRICTYTDIKVNTPLPKNAFDLK